MNSLGVSRAASLWYPIMLAQERGEISESKGAELLGMNIVDYRKHKENAIYAVMRLVSELPSPLTSLVEAIAARPELFETTASASSSSGKETPSEST
jgi:hypothetical protein